MNEDRPQTAEDCSLISDGEGDPERSIMIVPEPNESVLTEKENVDYWEYRKQYISYLLKLGKNEKKAKGYSPYTVYADVYRTAAFDRWVWANRTGGYQIPPTEEDANTYLEEIAFSDDHSQTSKGKIQEALRRYSKWLQYQFSQEKWEFSYNFDGSGGNHQPQDFLTVDERQQIRQAALDKGSIPSYDYVSPEERKQWKGYIAQELDKPFDEVSPDDWQKIDGWKITSLVWTSLDAGLRPAEVGNARLSWVDIQNEVLRIPKDESSKNEGNWIVSITSRTASSLDRWLQERENRHRYNESDRIWLTMRGNPYGSKSLRRLLCKLCEDAGIGTENRKMSWYSIRHSVGTYMTKERDLAAAKAQLRHKSAKTTMKYDQVPVEERQDALDKMG